MAYALQSMLRIRSMREDRAGKELIAARHERDAAQVELAKRTEKLEEYGRTKEERRDRVFDTIMQRVVSREDIDRVKDAVSRIDEEGILLQEGVSKAQQALEEREKEEDKAHVRFVIATKNHLKIKQHREIWEAEEQKLQERQQEAELEEFAGRRLSNDDYDDFE